MYNVHSTWIPLSNIDSRTLTAPARLPAGGLCAERSTAGRAGSLSCALACPTSRRPDSGPGERGQDRRLNCVTHLHRRSMMKASYGRRCRERRISALRGSYHLHGVGCRAELLTRCPTWVHCVAPESLRAIRNTAYLFSALRGVNCFEPQSLFKSTRSGRSTDLKLESPIAAAFF